MLFSSSKKTCLVRFSFFILLGMVVSCATNTQQEQTILPLISETSETEDFTSPLLRDLYESPSFQRLKKIDQSGPARYFHKIGFFSRYSHSLGVWALLKHYRCNLNEQATGLMHDVSHTAFSHLGDYIFSQDISKATVDASHQDQIHLSYLEKNQVGKILAKYGLKIEDLNPDSGHYSALEQSLPNLCADRIEYILHTGLVTKHLTNDEVREILKDLHFDGTNWFFTKTRLAKKLANLSLYYVKELWGAPWNVRMNVCFAEIIKRCFVLGVLTSDDLFLTDQEVLKKIQTFRKENKDPLIQLYWAQCEKINEDFANFHYKVIHIQPKFRGVDPFIKINGKLMRLTSLDSDYRQKFTTTKQWCGSGFDVKIPVFSPASER